MSTQQDIYAAGSENRPPMLNKENYVPWSSRLLRYAKSRPNGKLIYNSIMNGPYVRRMIPEPGDTDREVPVPATFHEQTDDELTVAEIKQMEADDQAIQTILLGLPEDIYAAVDSCETAQEIWLRVQQMMKGSDIGIQEKKAKLFNEWERFTSTDGESIESYYHRFSKLMNDFKRNKHFPEKIASNLKFLNNLQPEWSRHVTIVHQTKDLHTTDYTQLYDFLKYNQKEVDDQRAERLAKTHDPLALMANSNNPFNYPVFHQDQPSPSTYMQQPQPINNNYNPQPSFNQNYMQQPMPNPEDITDPTTAMNMALALMAKAFKLNYSTPTNNNQRISSNPRNRQIAQPGMNMGQDRQMRMYKRISGIRGLGHLARNCTVRPRRRDAAYLQTQLLIAQKEEAGIQLQAEEFDLMAAAADLDEIEEVNANCILWLICSKHRASGTQTDKAPVYDSDGSAEVHNYDNCYDNEIFNMFTQEEQYTEILEPIPEPHQVQQNDNVISDISCVEQEGGTVDQHTATVEETRAYFESLYNNLALEVEKKQPNLFETSNLFAKEADESLAKHKTLELEIERLLRAVVSQDIMSIVQNPSVVDSSNLQTELERTKERFKHCIIKKENEYAKLWNDWYKKCEECKYDKISYDKAYNDMQQKIERLQAQLGDLKGKSQDTPCVSNTLDAFCHRNLKMKCVELEFQVRNYEKEIAHLKTTYKNLFDSISVTRAQTKTITDSLQNKLHDTIYENAKLRAQLFDKVSDQVDTTKGTSTNTKFANQKVDETNDLSKPVTSNSVPTPQESKSVKQVNVIAPGMFRINPFKPSREEKYVPNKVRASVRTTQSQCSPQPHVVTKKDVNSDSNGLSSTGVDNTAKTRRPQPRSNTKNDRVPSASKSSCTRIKKLK
ncbi:hypothetical protein Tco_0525111 [Tanacetum coccineum]